MPTHTGRRLALTAVALMLSVGVSLALESGQSTQGDRDVPNNQVQERVRPSQPLSRAQAAALVQRRYHARVVRTHVLQGQGGQQLYEFRLLSSNGMVWTVRVDAQNGDEVP